ncbi:MAG: hypothetical protein AAGF20_10075 [Pseudomonadota bacterium]
MAKRLAEGLATKVLVRDSLHLKPPLISRAAAQRFRAGLRALEAFLRRLFVLMALEMADQLSPRANGATVLQGDAAPASKVKRTTARLAQPTFRIFIPDAVEVDWSSIRPGPAHAPRCKWDRPLRIESFPLLARLAYLKSLLDAPEARARRLAHFLLRKKLTLFPVHRLPARYGTEISACYAGLGAAISTARLARSPPPMVESDGVVDPADTFIPVDRLRWL